MKNIIGKRLLFVWSVTALAVLGITARAFCYQVEAIDISGTKYFPAVKEALSKAKESITVVMFVIEGSREKENSKPNQLVDALIEAKNRGVDVEVILDQNIDFVQRRHASEWGTKIKSAQAYKRFKEANIRVYYDDPARYTHAKAVIIDKKTIILGSTNWTESAFDKNIETNVLIDSPELAGEISAYLKTIRIDENIGNSFESTCPSISISREFLRNPKLAAQMTKTVDERSFDIYLYLLWKSEGAAESKLTLDYDELAKHLGIYEGRAASSYRRQIAKVLRKLEKKYRLIKFEPRFAKEATITLLEIPQEQAFELPEAYFDFGWNKGLSLSAKFCYLVNLAYSDISDTKPFWSKSVTTITKESGNVSRGVIHKGMAELRRKKLLEAKYDNLSGKPYEERLPKLYKILKLYDPKELALKLREVEERRGKQDYLKARKYAEIVFEENAPETIEDIILKTKEYGEKKVRKAFRIVAQKNPDNPLKTYNYAVGIIEK